MEIVFFIAFILLIVLSDFIPLCKSGKKGEIWVYSLLLIAGVCLITLKQFDVNIPTPAEPIKKMVQALFRIS